MQSKLTERTIQTEIQTIADNLKLGDKKDKIVRDANRIAACYLEANNLADPVTLGRASLFVALKAAKIANRGINKKLTNNNGHKDRWWFYLSPIVEKVALGH